MTPLVISVSVVGAVAVLTFLAYVVVRFTKGKENRVARTLLTTAAVAGICCAVIGVLFAIV